MFPFFLFKVDLKKNNCKMFDYFLSTKFKAIHKFFASIYKNNFKIYNFIKIVH